MLFETVEMTPEKSGKCAVCGKRCKRSKRFWQSINPLNTNDKGVPKSRKEVAEDIIKEIEKWHQEPITHAKCE